MNGVKVKYKNVEYILSKQFDGKYRKFIKDKDSYISLSFWKENDVFYFSDGEKTLTGKNPNTFERTDGFELLSIEENDDFFFDNIIDENIIEIKSTQPAYCGCEGSCLDGAADILTFTLSSVDGCVTCNFTEAICSDLSNLNGDWTLYLQGPGTDRIDGHDACVYKGIKGVGPCGDCEQESSIEFSGITSGDINPCANCSEIFNTCIDLTLQMDGTWQSDSFLLTGCEDFYEGNCNVQLILECGQLFSSGGCCGGSTLVYGYRLEIRYSFSDFTFSVYYGSATFNCNEENTFTLFPQGSYYLCSGYPSTIVISPSSCGSGMTVRKKEIKSFVVVDDCPSSPNPSPEYCGCAVVYLYIAKDSLFPTTNTKAYLEFRFICVGLGTCYSIYGFGSSFNCIGNNTGTFGSANGGTWDATVELSPLGQYTPCSGQSSSSSCAIVECNTVIDLIGECKLELDGGTIYSIGDQDVFLEVSDPCDCIEPGSLQINGEPAGDPPAYNLIPVSDGETISVGWAISSDCLDQSTVGPTCINNAAMNILKNGKLVTILKKAAFQPLANKEKSIYYYSTNK